MNLDNLRRLMLELPKEKAKEVKATLVRLCFGGDEIEQCEPPKDEEKVDLLDRENERRW